MASADNFTGLAGAHIIGGRVSPLPAWAANSVIGAWMNIPGTAGAGGSPAYAFSSFARRQNELIAAACGGHGDSSDNRVTSIDLSAASPAWVIRHAPSADADRVINTSYYLDGLPTSRHTYDMNIWVPGLNRLMMMGGRFTYGMYTSLKVDGFNLDTNQWDPAGYWPDNSLGFGGGTWLDGNGDPWTNNHRFDINSKTFLPYQITNSSTRYPYVYDTKRGQAFGMSWGDNEGFGTQAINATIQKTVPRGQNPVITAITFNPSAAVTKFSTDRPSSGGMAYDPVNDCFMWYGANNAHINDFYKIIPNNTTVWDMEMYPVAGATIPLNNGSGGLLCKVHYIPILKGIVIMPNTSQNMLYMRTS